MACNFFAPPLYLNVLDSPWAYFLLSLFLSFVKTLTETRRPPWLDTDPWPHDLENARKALLYEHNPNQPHSPDQLRAERLGLSTRPPHRRSHTAPAHMRMEKVEKVIRTTL